MSSNPYRLSLQSAGIHAGSSASAFKSSARHSYFCPLLRDKHTGSMFVYAVDAARTPLRSWWRGACEDARPDKWKKSPPSHRAEAPCCSTSTTSTSTAAQRNNVLLRKWKRFLNDASLQNNDINSLIIWLKTADSSKIKALNCVSKIQCSRYPISWSI